MTGEAVRLRTAPSWLRWTRTAATLRIASMRSHWAAQGQPSTVHDDVDMVLADADVPADPDVGRATEHDPRWTRLVEALGLEFAEQQWLALLATVHDDPRWGQVLGYLADDARPREVTPAAAAALWGWPRGVQPAPTDALTRWRLAGPLGAEPWLPTTPWALDPDIAGYLCDVPGWHSFWPGLDVGITAEADCLYPDLLEEIAGRVEALTDPARAPSGAVEVELVGAPGSGRRSLLTQLCARRGRVALVITDPGLGVRALRTARLLGAVPVWSGPAAGPDAPPIPLDGRRGALTLVTRTAPAPEGPVAVHGVRAEPAAVPVLRLSWRMPRLGRVQRRRLWSAHSSEPVPPVVDSWEMTPREVAAAAAATAGGPDTVVAVSRRRLGAVSSSLLSPLECPYSWDDLVLTDGVLVRLRELETQVRLSDPVLDGWGMRRLIPTSRGTTALLAGPSGTGKTMAAQVLARSLGLDLYRVNLAEVVNKYIGETEKRLAQVFDECERSGVAVLFDEADALFGQRTQVRDAHDRFANIEIDYLLQRMESFDGVALLATNRKSDLDSAFLRRIRIVIDFLLPGVPERLRLWERALPDLAPDGTALTDRLDRRWLADTIPLTGAEITSAALGAAFTACAEGSVIGIAHVLAAVRRELAKRGDVLRDDALRGAGDLSTSGTDSNGATVVGVR